MFAVKPLTVLTITAGGALLAGCAVQSLANDRAPRTQSPVSLLVGSTPAPGSTVAAPVEDLRLSFSPPARLDEVTVTGSEGTMPMMIHAVGEVADYSLPLAGLEAGPYTVNWRATSRGQTHHGSFAFTVR
jgi:methionine-rich copper-binding protein CopC